MARLLRLVLGLATLLALALTIVWWLARPAEPDEFYRSSPPQASAPGTLLRSEPFSKALPAGASAWRILYATTRADNTPAIASAVVFAASRTPSGPRPVIAWAHGTTGIVPGCAPSLMSEPFANVPAVELIVREDWVYVATDYAGLGTGGGHAYLVGEDAARAVLDSVRAARGLPQLKIDNRTVVWGHSQGGNSALWAGMRAADYAPDVNVLGVAALAPATDLKSLVTSARSSMFGKIVTSYLVQAYGAAYPDVRSSDYLHPRAGPIVGDIASRCVGEWPTLVSVAATQLLPNDGIFAKDPASGPLGARLLENTPLGPIAAPVLIAQGQLDDLVLPEVQQRFVASRCAAGQPIEHRIYDGLDHISLVAKASPLGADLIEWSRARLAGRPAVDNCPR